MPAKRERPTNDESIESDEETLTSKKQKKELNEEKKPKVDSNKKKEESNEKEWTLSKTKKVTVSEFRGKKLVQIREYYEKDGELKPSSKGLALSIDLWKKFQEELENIKKSFEDGNENVYELTSKKKVSVTKFKNQFYVDFREFFEKDGQTLPTKKGIMLNKAVWDELCSIVEEINQEVGDA